MSNKPNLFQQVTVTVGNQSNLNAAIVKAVLAKLGLRSEAQIGALSSQHGYGDLSAYFLPQIRRYKDWHTQAVRMARIKGAVWKDL